jgi:hypothetical protein
LGGSQGGRGRANQLTRSRPAAGLDQALAVCPVLVAPDLGGLGTGDEQAALARVVGSAPRLIPAVVAFAVPLLPRPGVGADLVVTVAARARRRLGLPGHCRGSDEPGQQHGSRGRRQHRRQMKAEPHVVPFRAAEPRTRRHRVDRGSGPLSPAALQWGNVRRSTSFGDSRRTRPNRSAPRRRQRLAATRAALPRCQEIQPASGARQGRTASSAAASTTPCCSHRLSVPGYRCHRVADSSDRKATRLLTTLRGVEPLNRTLSGRRLMGRV